MKKLILIIFCFLPFLIRAQVTPFANDFKSIYIGDNGVGDYTRDLILVHEIYNATAIDINYAVGTISAFRGSPVSYNRINIAEINSSSAYTSSAATLRSFDDVLTWKLKTCLYNGKKYLALDVPYSPAFHNFGYRFTGSTHSTGENMKSIAYQVNGQAVNQNVISDIQDYVPNMNESHFVNNFTVMGNVGIGTATPAEKLSVNGKIRAHEIKVEAANWPDYVFEQDYKILGLQELDAYIKANKHLPEMPSAKEVEANGMALGEMVKRQQKKIEELTLHLIEKDKEIVALRKDFTSIKQFVQQMAKGNQKLKTSLK